MAGFVIAVVAGLLPLVIGMLGLGRARVGVGIGGGAGVVVVIGGVRGFGGLVAAAAQREPSAEEPPLWFFAGLVMLLYAIWCGGLWLGVRLRRMRRATPG